MAAVPISSSTQSFQRDAQDNSANWLRIAAAGTLAVSGVLLLSGKRRAGMVTAASGTALAMIDQQETVRAWWDALPGCLEEMQGLLCRVQGVVDELSAQREKLHKVLAR